MEGDREEILSQGLDDFLAKPIKIDELETMIVKHVNSLEDH
jgi:CheY-like chemotaxis protein